MICMSLVSASLPDPDLSAEDRWRPCAELLTAAEADEWCGQGAPGRAPPFGLQGLPQCYQASS